MKYEKNIASSKGSVQPPVRPDAGWRLPGGAGLADYAHRAGFLAPALLQGAPPPAGRPASAVPVRARGRVR